ncbi:MAG: type I restriction endonuclease subunit R [Salinisphaeraceae bacterium]
MPNFISEDDIERALVGHLTAPDGGFQTLNCYTEHKETLPDGSGRADKRDVTLADRLCSALAALNPTLPQPAIEQAVAVLTSSRAAMSPVAANHEVYNLIRNGVPVTYRTSEGLDQPAQAKVIDFDNPANNDLLAVTQLWIAPTGQGRRWRRPDVLLYVNGLPLVFIELKNSNVKLRTAFDKNLTDYRADIPQLFIYNAFLMLSNALDTRVGSITAGWDYFFHWLRPEDEKEKIDREAIAESASAEHPTSLERAADGLLHPARLLDYVENFILFYKDSQKIIAQNHQYIGVNRALERVRHRKEHGNEAQKLGVFWHTQGSGKSFAMIFYTRKIQRKIGGHYTFVIVTDREDLDGQIYRNFLHTDTVREQDAARPGNSAKMREALGQHKRILFTLIQKFGYDKGKKYPLLSDRDDIIVIVDEAHRTQYKSLAENMRAGLPNAGYLAFTGTPLLGKERKTHTWFGGYVSEYNFRQSMDDGATVPLFYEKRVPEVLIQNPDLGDDFYELLESENLTDAEEAKLEKEFAKETEVIKRDDRLDKIAADIVTHFPRRGYLGKGMVISVDKYTAVTMYDKVAAHWKAEMTRLVGEIGRTTDALEKQRMRTALAFMRSTEMAVVISEEAGEDERFAARGLDIKPHRERMDTTDKEGQDIEANFKDPDHPLRLVFVCAMWLTGFDAPTLSTLYLDKPQKDHTLMQTIARANRVTGHLINGKAKKHGEVVDYYNVFRNMKRALKDYAEGNDDEVPVREKSELFVLLDDALAEGAEFLEDKGIDLQALLGGESTFKSLTAFERYADTLLSSDAWRRSFNIYENTISSLYEACKPEILAGGQRRPLVYAFQYLRGVLDGKINDQDVDALRQQISQLLDISVVADRKNAQEEHETYQITQRGKQWDLRKLDIEKLKAEFKQQEYKHIEIEDLRAFIAEKLEEMLKINSKRTPFAERFAEIIDRYNSGSASVEQAHEELIDELARMEEEEERHIREHLTEEELEVFDILQKDGLTKAEEQQVKLAAKALLKRLHEEKPKVLIEGWHRDTQSQLRVRSTLEEVLNNILPDAFDRRDFSTRSDEVFELLIAQAAIKQRQSARL